MGEVDKRLFIGNLCHDISQQDLKEKFSRFGVVHSVQIKTRKNDTGMLPKLLNILSNVTKS